MFPKNLDISFVQLNSVGSPTPTHPDSQTFQLFLIGPLSNQLGSAGIFFISAHAVLVDFFLDQKDFCPPYQLRGLVTLCVRVNERGWA